MKLSLVSRAFPSVRRLKKRLEKRSTRIEAELVRLQAEHAAAQSTIAELRVENAALSAKGTRDWTRHRHPEILAPVSGSVRDNVAHGDDMPLVSRVLAAYCQAQGGAEERGNSIWRDFFEQRHRDLHTLFTEGGEAEAAQALRDPSSNQLFYGFDNLFIEFTTSLDALPDVSSTYASMCHDELLRLAECIGCARLDNPEIYHVRIPSAPQVDELIARLDRALACQLTFPNPYPREFGLRTAAGLASYRAIHAIYQAWRIRELVRGIERPRVLEIGGGLGRTAYYARQLGIEDYTLIDLPFTAISQGYFLGRTLGEDQIRLHGEAEDDQRKRVNILLPDAFLDGLGDFDLIVNVDSLTEMDPGIARSYWQKIESSARQFLSINHEANSFTVKELIDSSTRVATRVRNLCWIRRGYAEEIVQFTR